MRILLDNVNGVAIRPRRSAHGTAVEGPPRGMLLSIVDGAVIHPILIHTGPRRTQLMTTAVTEDGRGRHRNI